MPLKIENLDLSYSNGIKALAGINVSVTPGEFVSLIGPSGCGKSTLLKITAGLLPNYSGTVSFGGLAPEIYRRQKKIGFVFQAPTLLPWRTTLQNVELPLELNRTAIPDRRNAACEVLERVGLKDFANAYPQELSGGMRMRAAIARALVIKPDLLLMDEPFGALDEITREKLNEDLLQWWSREKCTVFFVTHNVHEAVYLSSRVIVMSPRPGTILHDEKIPFSFPRELALREQNGFTSISAKLSGFLRKHLPS